MQPTSREEASIHEFGARLTGVEYIDRPGAYAVIENREKQIAVIETQMGYFLPGGGIESGETEVEALKREFIEETGYGISVIAEIGQAVEYLKADGDPRGFRIQSKFFTAQLGPKIGEGTEADHRLVWLTQEDGIRLLKRQGQAWAVQMSARFTLAKNTRAEPA